MIPRCLMYRPANSVPYATVEADLTGVFVKFCMMDPKGKLITQNTSELEQKCCTFQHWIHQWTHGNLLVTQLEGKPHVQNDQSHFFLFLNMTAKDLKKKSFSLGVEAKISNIKIATKSKGFVSQSLHVCFHAIIRK